MIGVIPKPDQIPVVREFFQLFKTPWELYDPGTAYDVIIATANEIPKVKAKLLLVYGSAIKNTDSQLGIVADGLQKRPDLSDGDTLFPVYHEPLTFADSSEGKCCLRAGREVAGLRLSSSDSTVVRLGYDVFDEVQFLLSAGQPLKYGHIPTLEIHISMLRNWILEAGIPLIEIPPTPAGHRFVVCLANENDFAGLRNHRHKLRRRVTDTDDSGIDVEMPRPERGTKTLVELERAGYAYDAVSGYNETIGYRAGTTQVFRPLDALTLLKLPLHIQNGDGSDLQTLHVSEPEAVERWQMLIDNATKFGGVFTLLSNDKSEGPEWMSNDLYVSLLKTLKTQDVWFGSAAEVVGWFNTRRLVRFEAVEGADVASTRLIYQGKEIQPPWRVRVHRPVRAGHYGGSTGEVTTKVVDTPWSANRLNRLSA